MKNPDSVYDARDTKAMAILITDLNKLPPSEFRDMMISKAEKYVYGDYNDELTTEMGSKFELVVDCQNGGAAFMQIGKDALAGKYDA